MNVAMKGPCSYGPAMAVRIGYARCSTCSSTSSPPSRSSRPTSSGCAPARPWPSPGPRESCGGRSRNCRKNKPHFHSEVQHRPFPQRARSPGAEDRPVMANPGPGAPEIRARGDRSPVETQRSRALRTVQAAPRGRRRPAGRREGGARPRSAGRRRPFLSPDQSLRNAIRDGSGQGGRAFRNASAGVM